ncbi:hypothetical protein Tco_1463838, partial [Tanacetum coccineum]
LAMLNLAKLEFLALDISGQNYLSWVLDAEIYLAANGLIFLRHHLHENFKFKYLTVKDQLVLWNHLKDRYEHQKTYCERGFKKYCDLISCLLVAEQNNELLMKNHESRPTGSAPLSEANVVTYDQSGGRGRGSDRVRGRGHGCGRGQWRGFGRG